MTPIDLSSATALVGALVTGVGDDQLGDPTPCPAWTVADLVDHVGGVAVAFAAAGKRWPAGGRPGAGVGVDGRLEAGWRGRIAEDLAVLVEAWRPPAAWEGTTRVGSMELPADVAGQVCLNELVVHGWDLARATGRAHPVDDRTLAAVHRFVAPLAMMDPEGSGAFAAPVALPDGAEELDVVLAQNGRSPSWAPDR